ncbi:MAG: hemolysin III family protein [Rhizobiaceae bacterium]|nr:hemolysin III family protein [Rhizobiaceae bacterium]
MSAARLPANHARSRRPLPSKAELVADGIVHAVGIVLTLAAGATLIALLAIGTAGPWERVAAVLYVVSLLAVFSISCAYNLWPDTPTKWLLRRFDHAAIFVLIAGTYTPFLTQLDPATMKSMLAVVWGAAAVGVAVKLLLPGKLDRIAVVFYLALGWSGAAIVGDLMETLPAATLGLILAGGIVYSVGVVFYAWDRLRFSRAVWHGFVVTAAGLHLAAAMHCLVLAKVA